LVKAQRNELFAACSTNLNDQSYNIFCKNKIKCNIFLGIFHILIKSSLYFYALPNFANFFAILCEKLDIKYFTQRFAKLNRKVTQRKGKPINERCPANILCVIQAFSISLDTYYNESLAD
jgi:hypothetical protein